MTNKEFSDEFDVLIDNARIGYGNIRFLDEYEKSVFLTEAQNQVVTLLYNNFEQSESNRRYLKDLITLGSTKSYTVEDAENKYKKIAPNPRRYSLEENVKFILYEWCTLESDNNCLEGKTIPVVPIIYEDLAKVLRNPFRGSNKNRIVRIDYGKEDSNIKVELLIPEIYKNESIVYNYKYLKKLTPIILEDLQNDLSIGGITKETECQLDSSLHRTILETAVKLALASKISSSESQNV